MYRILGDNMNDFDKYYDNFGNEKYLIQMHSQAKTSVTKLPKVHRVQKGLDPHLRPEKQHTIPKLGKSERPRMGQGRAGSKRKKPDHINQAISQPSNLSKELPRRASNTENKQHTQYKQYE